MICKICQKHTSKFDTAKILGKYEINYYYCSECGFLRTEDPYWLEEAYSKAIVSFDTGIMMRNMYNSTNLLFFKKFIKNGPCLDFGGGYGILTRIMRDYGFDFYNYDKYAQNLLASGFSGDLQTKYTLVTSFENFEHFADPIKEIEAIFNITETLYFSTLLLPHHPPQPSSDTWWYYALDGGQHISFFSKKTLKYIANKYNMYFITNNVDTHIFSKSKISKHFFNFLRLYRIINSITVSRFLKKQSKHKDDMDSLLSQLKSANK